MAKCVSYFLNFYLLSNTFFELAKQSVDPSMKRITEDYIIHYNTGDALNNLTEGKVVMWESFTFVDYQKRCTDPMAKLFLMCSAGWTSPPGLVSPTCTL
jgi:hypothetical protein